MNVIQTVVDDMVSAAYTSLTTLVGSGGKLVFYTGGPELDPGDGPTGILVAECAMSNPPFNTPSGESFPANAITSDTDTDAGTVQSYWLMDSVDTPIACGNAGDTTEEFVFDDATFGDGDTCQVDSFEITVSGF